MSDLLLDTCAVLWVTQGVEIKPEARKAISDASTLHVSPITAWEIANLVRKNRIALTMPAARWFRAAIEKLDADTPDLTIDVLTQSCDLPGSPPTDPADRIIIATARETSLEIVTRDAAILAYSRAGHVRSREC